MEKSKREYDAGDELVADDILGVNTRFSENVAWLLDHGFREKFETKGDTLETETVSVGFERKFRVDDYFACFPVNVVIEDAKLLNGYESNPIYFASVESEKISSHSIDHLGLTYRYQLLMTCEKCALGRKEECSMRIKSDRFGGSLIGYGFRHSFAETAVKLAITYALDVIKEMDKLFKEHPAYFVK